MKESDGNESAHFQPGLVVLLGSGETQPSSSKTHEYVAQMLPPNPTITILQTPAGFELNSSAVAGRIKTFLERRLQDYSPKVQVIAARKRGTFFSPDNMEIIAPLFHADEIMLGPGSPTYCTRQLQGSRALDIIRSRHRLGVTLFLSSAATVAFSRYAIPVYEIYKVGDDPYWNNGLDFLGDYGLGLVIVPHWNNNDGGEELDTSHCYIGKSRFETLLAMLPKGIIVIGIDDHTSLIIDLVEGCCRVLGNDSVTILQYGQRKVYRSGEEFPVSLLGEYRRPMAGEGIDALVWQEALKQENGRLTLQKDEVKPPKMVDELLVQRLEARNLQDWQRADQIRDQIFALGWQVLDTLDGSRLIRTRQ